MFLNRMDALQEQVQMLQGQLEMQSHQIQGLQEQLKQDPTLFSKSSPAKIASTEVIQEHGQKDDVPQKNDKTEYARLFSLLQNKRLEAARQGFMDFIEHYPDSSYRVNAYYWLGEIQLSAGDYDQAFAFI